MKTAKSRRCCRIGVAYIVTLMIICIFLRMDFNYQSTSSPSSVIEDYEAIKWLADDPEQLWLNALIITPTPQVEQSVPSQEVKAYQKQEEDRCLEKIASRKHNSSRLPPCPCISPDLQGLRPAETEDEPDGWDGVIHRVGRDVLLGGEWRPATCEPDTHLAVVIPCRDRDSHLRIMLRHLIPILQRQLAHFRIFVVEQNSPAVFNKAAMMNIGFMEASKRFALMDCVVYHDVDHMLEDDRALMNCSPQPHHYAASMDEWNYRLIYGGAFGGVISMLPGAFRTVNGYSLQYFGWGGEDDDMGDRVRQFWKVFRPPFELCRYTTIKHLHDNSNPKNNKRHGLMDHQHQRYVNGSFDGLSDISYQLNDVQLRPLYTWIHADLNVSGLSTYPSHRVHRYRRVPGVCRWAGVDAVSAGSTADVSWTTCRYMCDVELRRPCVAFSYRPSAASVSDPPPKCHLLATVCDLVTSRADAGATYLKGPPVTAT